MAKRKKTTRKQSAPLFAQRVLPGSVAVEAKRAPTHRDPVDEHAATELVMYIENTSDLSPDGPSGQGRSVLLNALRKWKKGTYDSTKAVRLFEYLAESGAKRYAKEFGSSEKEWSTMFTPATRHEAAKQLEASFRNSVEHGEYDHIDTRIGREAREENHEPPPWKQRNYQSIQDWMIDSWNNGDAARDGALTPLQKAGLVEWGSRGWQATRAGIDRGLKRMGGLEETHVVRDFNTLNDLVRHAMHDLGATHASGGSSNTKIYFPHTRGSGTYEEANVWAKSGYWHAQGPGSRETVERLPKNAETIKAWLEKHGEGYTAEAKRKPSVKLTPAEQFFYSHAGFGYPTGSDAKQQEAAHVQHAKSLARAEAESEKRGWTIEWEHDQDADTSWMDPEQLDDYESGRTEILTAILRNENGDVLASIGGVALNARSSQRDDYGRVVEAELAQEALDGGLNEPRQVKSNPRRSAHHKT